MSGIYKDIGDGKNEPNVVERLTYDLGADPLNRSDPWSRYSAIELTPTYDAGLHNMDYFNVDEGDGFIQNRWIRKGTQIVKNDFYAIMSGPLPLRANEEDVVRHLLIAEVRDVDKQLYAVLEVYADYLFVARQNLHAGHEYKARKFYKEARHLAELHGFGHTQEIGKNIRAEIKGYKTKN